ncbi:hypothetical protein PRIPAC_84679, partial [Pristionchus pacificus]|uniref:Uncharacterized protein n=1 Tax=Pristionchus pacificus TaxID=54126 RepID=A0A2A6CEG0_PRIPA
TISHLHDASQGGELSIVLLLLFVTSTVPIRYRSTRLMASVATVLRLSTVVSDRGVPVTVPSIGTVAAVGGGVLEKDQLTSTLGVLMREVGERERSLERSKVKDQTANSKDQRSKIKPRWRRGWLGPKRLGQIKDQTTNFKNHSLTLHAVVEFASAARRLAIVMRHALLLFALHELRVVAALRPGRDQEGS